MTLEASRAYAVPGMIHDFVMPGAKKIIEQAHSYGVKVIYHSCGAIFDAMPELIEAGADFIHPLQATAVGMDRAGLKMLMGKASLSAVE